jgi:hypothetical protein
MREDKKDIKDRRENNKRKREQEALEVGKKMSLKKKRY